MFRLNTMDAQKIIESIPNKYDYDKIVVFIDFDNMLFGIYNEENYNDFVMYVQRMVQAIEQTLTKLHEFHETLNNFLPTRLVHYASFGKDNIRAFCKSFKEKRYKQIKAVGEIVKFIHANTQMDEVMKGTRQLILSILRNIINTAMKDQVFILTYKVESDIIPYLLLDTYYKENNLYIIFSADKDYVQLLDKKNIILFRTTYFKNTFFQTMDKRFTVIKHNTIIEDVKPFKDKWLNILYHALKGDQSDRIPSLKKKYRLPNKFVDLLKEYDGKIKDREDLKKIAINEYLHHDLAQEITKDTIKCETGIPIHSNLFQVSFELQKEFALSFYDLNKIVTQIRLLKNEGDYKDYANKVVNEIFGLNIY